MLSVEKLIKSAWECLGWPYVTPGSNDAKGIDCSGLFVKMFRDQGASIYHGSNTIFHDYCSQTGRIDNVLLLKPGMAVFKMKAWTEKDKNNKWYGKEPGNLSHIGIVVSAYPDLQIIHASSDAGQVTVDSKVGKWVYWGKLKDVDYSGEGGSEEPAVNPGPSPAIAPVIATVYSPDGGKVKIRFRPSTKCGLYEELPSGTTVIVEEKGGEWSKVSHGNRIDWYMMTKFLRFEGDAVPSEPDTPADEPVSVVKMAEVISENGKPVKMRSKSSTKNGLYDEVPVGTIVMVDLWEDEWSKISYGIRKGWYMQTQYLKPIEDKEA